ncbi:hypothetical protein DFQ28_006453 [Apophysomyces sp. BC1034]|nr:hypothetical protein DFQ30_004321 [Apophysomyces sp. BC1015]KAG0182470.1 hypothetical protein DFQ29_003899 [Apophysomyces sp. BC1021]KAG0193078.1 hypothetical protein DFQ28_006453 [Apophysomyces sp. BC1034]
MDLSQSTPELTEDQTSPSHSMTSLPSHRVFHNIEASTYWLPKDEEEQERLTVQHLAIKELYNGNVLTSTFDYVNLEENCRVLDVGCGSGIWAMDMAMAYPKSEFIGVDIADVRVQNIELDNVTFGHGNVLERLDFPDNSFDLVHMRLFVLALREDEWPGAVREAFRLVKPGGVLHLMEYDILVNGNEIVRKGMQAVQDTCRDRGQDPNIALQIERLASEAGGKVVQTDYRLVQFTNQTNLGKNFVWDWKQGFKSGMKLLGPKLGLETPEDQKKFLEEISVGMATSGATVGLNGVVARKPL